MRVGQVNKPWDEYARTTPDLKIAKGLTSEDILKRYAERSSTAELAEADRGGADKGWSRGNVLFDPAELISG